MKDCKENLIYRQFIKRGIIRENGHFIYSSGRHGSEYVDHYAMFADPVFTNDIILLLARKIQEENRSTLREIITVDTVLGPENGGIILSQNLAVILGDRLNKKIYSVWAIKGPSRGELFLPDAFKKYVSGKKIIAADDVATTGGTINKLKDVVRVHGGEIIAAVCLWNRGGVNEKKLNGTKIFSLIDKKFNDWDKKDCPLCKDGMPVDESVGHVQNFTENT